MSYVMPGNCKGQRSSEFIERAPPIWTAASTQITQKKQASPLFLELVHGTVSGFVTFYSVRLWTQCYILCSLRQLSLVTFGPYASWWVMSQEIHSKTMLEILLIFCRPDLSNLAHSSLSHAATNKYSLLCFLFSYLVYCDSTQHQDENLVNVPVFDSDNDRNVLSYIHLQVNLVFLCQLPILFGNLRVIQKAL